MASAVVATVWTWDPFADDAPTLAGLAAASVRGVAALAFDEAQATPSPVEGWGPEPVGRRDGGEIDPFA